MGTYSIRCIHGLYAPGSTFKMVVALAAMKKGIISTKDILKAMANQSINLEESVTDSIRDVFFVPETKRIAELFNELRQTGNQIAIAIDEFGGIAGLVSYPLNSS